VVAVKKKRAGKFQHPERRKMTVLLAPELYRGLEDVCQSMGASKNTVALMGIAWMTYLLHGMREGDTRMAKHVLLKHLETCLPG
jgi:hypothetical protein